MRIRRYSPSQMLRPVDRADIVCSEIEKSVKLTTKSRNDLRSLVASQIKKYTAATLKSQFYEDWHSAILKKCEQTAYSGLDHDLAAKLTALSEELAQEHRRRRAAHPPWIIPEFVSDNKDRST